MNTATLDVNALKAALCAVSTEETRYYLNGVLIEVSADSVTYVATDGHILFAHRAAVNDGNTLLGRWIIPSEVIKGIKITRPLKSLPYLVLSESDEGLSLAIVAESTKIGFKPIDGHFPDWRRVLPESPSGKIEQGVQFNPTLLTRLWKAGEVMGWKAPALTYNDTGAALVSYGHGDSVGAIMPMKGAAAAELPSWARVSHEHQVTDAVAA